MVDTKKVTLKPERDFGEGLLGQEAVQVCVSVIYEIDLVIAQYAEMLDSLQPGIEGKITIRWLLPANGKRNRSLGAIGGGAAAPALGGVAYGRRPQFVRWYRRSEGFDPNSVAVHLSLYELVPLETVLQRLMRAGRFKANSTETREVCKRIVELMRQRKSLMDMLSKFRSVVRREANRKRRVLTDLEGVANTWAPVVAQIRRSDTAKLVRAKQSRQSTRAAIPLVEGELPATPNPFKVRGERR